MKEAVVRIPIEPELKEDAEKVFKAIGLNTAEAVRMFFHQVRIRKELPFAIESPENDDLLVSTQIRQTAIDSVYDD